MNRLTPRLSRYLEHLGSPIDFHLSKCNDHKQVELVIFIRDIPEDQLSSVLEDVEVLSKLVRICYIIGYGDGKISETHIHDTPTKNKLIKERRRLYRKYIAVIREYQPTW